jgi:hypothetical protein
MDSRVLRGEIALSWQRLIVIAVVVIATGAGTSLLLEPHERTTTIATTVVLTQTVTNPTPGPQASSPGPQDPDTTRSDGPQPRWSGKLRLAFPGYELTTQSPSPVNDAASADISLSQDGDIYFDFSTKVAVWDDTRTPSLEDCGAQFTQSLSTDEAYAIHPEAGLALCTSTGADPDRTVGYVRVRQGFTKRGVLVDAMLWTAP